MTDTGDWSPDEPSDAEAAEPWDEALDAEDELEPDEPGAEGERSLDRQLALDQAEVDEAGLTLDDPERMAVLEGDIDDPDGVGAQYGRGQRRPGEEGWDLDAAERVTEDELDSEEDLDSDGA